MSDANAGNVPDEQVYQDNKREVEVKVVYSAEPEERDDQTRAVAQQDEVSAESFPASDAPATTSTTPGKPNT